MSHTQSAASLLTIGMATHGEPDSVWFTLTALTANHPRVSYLVVDNTPERDHRTEAITRASGGVYLHRPDLVGTSKPRDAVFRYATTPWVMCIDSHVVLETGAVQAAIDFCAANADSKDLVQGPMIYDDGRGFATHWNQVQAGKDVSPGLWGTWCTDERGASPSAELFEVPMMGLGLWMMRRDAWPGFNPLFRGFGGEEGYTHERVRRRGGKCLCHPAIRWRHKFRDVGGWNKNPAPPYPLRLEDHVWNLLVGHRELGIDALSQIFDHFGKRLPRESWDKLVAESERAQSFGGSRPEVKRQKILALWYSDNNAPLPLLQRSSATVVHAAEQTQRHDATISACAWQPIAGATTGRFGHHFRLFAGERKRSHATIVAQIEQAVQAATASGTRYDAVAFCEHDVLYPPNYFDRIGDALAANPDAPVISNLDYIGLNSTGWQKVKEHHDPLHQLTLRWDVFVANLARVKEEAKDGAQINLEPYAMSDRSKWVRIIPASLAQDMRLPLDMPAVHVNHGNNFTGHAAVCYHPQGYSLWHPHWGEAKQWWLGQMTAIAEVKAQFKDASKTGGCSACQAKQVSYESLNTWFMATQPSDFHEHMQTLRDLAANCQHATEISRWYKSADIAIAAGLGEKGAFVSLCPGRKPNWSGLEKLMGERFKGIADDGTEIEETDLLFIDQEHTADALYPLLEKHHSRVQKYIVVHCTETFGEQGDVSGRPGVMHALRKFCHEYQTEWVVKRRDRNNHGLMVLSKCPEDVKELPGLWRKAMNYAAAMTRHVAAGRPTVSLEVLEQRQATCAVCEERALDSCAACGCPLEAKLPLATETCGLVKKGLPPRWEAVA